MGEERGLAKIIRRGRRCNIVMSPLLRTMFSVIQIGHECECYHHHLTTHTCPIQCCLSNTFETAQDNVTISLVSHKQVRSTHLFDTYFISPYVPYYIVLKHITPLAHNTSEVFQRETNLTSFESCVKVFTIR